VAAGYLVIDQIEKEIAQNFGNRSDLGLGRIDTWLDMAHMRIARLTDWEELHLIMLMYPGNSGSLDVDRYLFLPTDVRIRKLFSIRRTINNTQDTPGKLDKYDSKKWDEVLGDTRYYSRGTPIAYHMWESGRVELFRVPDVTYELEVRLSKWPDSLAVLITQQGGRTQAKSNFKNMDDALIFLATSIGFLSFGRSDKATEYYNIYRTIMKESYDLDEEDLDSVQAFVRANAPISGRGYDDPFVTKVR
jgi:hypothetical protein